MWQIILGIILIAISLYHAHIHRDLRISSVSIAFVHGLFIWGLYDITGSIRYSLISVISITTIFGISTFVFIMQTRMDNERIHEIKERGYELYEKIWRILEDEEDPLEFLILFTEFYKMAQKLQNKEVNYLIEKMLNVISVRRDVFARKEIGDFAKKNRIPRRFWWFYMSDIRDVSSI